MANKNFSWNEVKRRLHGSTTEKLLEVIRDLYQLNSNNRRFLRRTVKPETQLSNWIPIGM